MKFVSEQMTEQKFHFFHNGPLSQWATSTFTREVDGKKITFYGCEQCVMGMKALLFQDFKTYELIMKETNPSSGRQGVGSTSTFFFGSQMGRTSVSKDAIWGIGMAVGNPLICDSSLWGLNLLGKALMEIREVLRSKNK